MFVSIFMVGGGFGCISSFFASVWWEMRHYSAFRYGEWVHRNLRKILRTSSRSRSVTEHFFTKILSPTLSEIRQGHCLGSLDQSHCLGGVLVDSVFFCHFLTGKCGIIVHSGIESGCIGIFGKF